MLADLLTYRATDAAGASDRRYFTINVLDEGDPGTVLHETGGALSDLPSGAWEPDVLTAGSVSTSSSDGGLTEVEIDRLEYFEQGGNRYTCLGATGCAVRNRELVSGSILQVPADGETSDGA